MARFYGPIGFAPKSVETSPGVWEEIEEARNYYGDMLMTDYRTQPTQDLNDDLKLSNRVSIVADPFALMNFSQIKYVEWMGTRWKVTNVEVQRPRIILSFGGVYNG